MGRRQRDCQRCGAPVGYLDRVLCCRCTAADRLADVKAPCPRCGKQRILRPDTGWCTTCSRCCDSCQAPVRRNGDTLCRACRRRAAAQAEKKTCPKCSNSRRLNPQTGWCARCSRPAALPKPPRPCGQCAQPAKRLTNGLCSRCWQSSPQRPWIRAATLTTRLGDDTPDWLAGLVANVTDVYSPSHATEVLRQLDRLLGDGGPTHPQHLIERAGFQSPRSALPRTLESYFVSAGLAVPTDRVSAMEAARVRRLVDAVPAQLRPEVADYAATLGASSARATTAATRARAATTQANKVRSVRDLARYLSLAGKLDWALTNTEDIVAFLAQCPTSQRPTHVRAGKEFFAGLRRRRVVLTNPVAGLKAPQHRGFRGATAALDQQRRLFRRWTRENDVHPHEALYGLLALLHGATSQEVRTLQITSINTADRTVQLGRRPAPTPLDPATWQALEKCLQHRTGLKTANPHVLVTRGTKAGNYPASPWYVTGLLRPSGITARTLRVTRLAELVNTMDPKMVASAFGMNPEGVLNYLADHVDPGRIPDELANLSTFGAT